MRAVCPEFQEGTLHCDSVPDVTTGKSGLGCRRVLRRALPAAAAAAAAVAAAASSCYQSVSQPVHVHLALLPSEIGRARRLGALPCGMDGHKARVV